MSREARLPSLVHSTSQSQTFSLPRLRENKQEPCEGHVITLMMQIFGVPLISSRLSPLLPPHVSMMSDKQKGNHIFILKTK